MRILVCLLAALTLANGGARILAQGTAFTYQGGLTEAGAPANGSFDFTFALYNDPLGGSQIGVTRTNLALSVSNGLFTTTLDFTGAPWDGQALWLQVLVRTNGTGVFSVLTPRQAFTSAPYAIQSLNAATANSSIGPLSGDVTGTESATTVASVGGQPAASVATGTIAANTATSTTVPGAIVARDATGSFAAGAITAASFSGDGSRLGNLNPGNLALGVAGINISGSAATVTGNIADSQLSANVAFLNASNLFSGIFEATNGNNLFNGTFAGSLNGNATTANSATTANNFTGSLSGDVIGTQGATTVVTVGGQSAASIASGVSAANAATSANGSNTIVMRDPSGNFSAGAITAAAFSGDGSGLINLNPASLITGTAAISISGSAATVTGNIADSQLSANVPFLNGDNLFSQTNEFAGVTVATNSNNLFNGTFTGNLSGNAQSANNFTGSLSGDVVGTQGAATIVTVGGLDAGSVAAGASAAKAATSANVSNTIISRDSSGGFAAGVVTAAAFSGDGGGLTNLNPASLVSGTAAINISGNAATATSASTLTGNIADSQLSPNVAQLNGTNSFTGTNNFAGVTVATNANNAFNGTFTGTLNGNATTATSAIQAATALTANNFSGSLLGQVVGTQGATTVVAVGGQSAGNVASGASAANAATSANTASTIVKRDASGNFSAGTITANFNGNGSALTNLNPSQLNFGSSGNIDIGTGATSGDSATIRVGTSGIQGSAFVAGIYGATAASGVPVFVTSSNQLGTLTSSRRFKEDIQNMDDASDTLLALHPVTFRYKPEIDPVGVPQFGLVAEDVEKVNPDLVAHDPQGRPYTVRYEAVNAMLLNEFLKEHRKVEAQNAKIDELTQRLDRLEKMIPTGTIQSKQ
jgi:hypothetical protein